MSTLGHTATWDIAASYGTVYRIQISWPLAWETLSGHEHVSVFYVLDGDSVFLTATETAWRRATGPFSSAGIVVAVGYANLDGRKLFSPERDYDLTPPRIKGGIGKAPQGFGGAARFLEFIQHRVKPWVQGHVLEGSTVGREALYGHSYGGLFSLYALYTQSQLFDTFIASSPSAWYDNGLIFEYERAFRRHHERNHLEAVQVPQLSQLMLFYGSYEQYPPQAPGEDGIDYEKRRKSAEDRAMTDNTMGTYHRLLNSACLRAISCKEYPDEDHGTVIACSLSRSMTTFFENWPLDTGSRRMAGGKNPYTCCVAF